jgi:hypothetical protein
MREVKDGWSRNCGFGKGMDENLFFYFGRMGGGVAIIAV